MATLMWILRVERPLKPSDLRYALAVEIGSPNFNSDNVPSIETLLSCCQGLVVVDRGASTVRLIHFTLQEYLRAHPELFSTAHSTIAETCLSYLDSQQIRAVSISRHFYHRGRPFLEYSSLYWGVHAKRDLSDCAKRLALKLFDDCSNHVSVKMLARQREPGIFINTEKPLLFSGLHWASIFGIARNQYGQTPLCCSLENGHEGVVKVLLGQDDLNPAKRRKLG